MARSLSDIGMLPGVSHGMTADCNNAVRNRLHRLLHTVVIRGLLGVKMAQVTRLPALIGLEGPSCGGKVGLDARPVKELSRLLSGSSRGDVRSNTSERTRTLVFVNYRVADNPLGAAAIHDFLARRFGQHRVFRDCVSIMPGDRYPQAIYAALERASVLVAVIGAQWLTLTDPKTGRLRIHRRRDWVRRELAWAFRQSITVLPVLLDGAKMPSKPELPKDIAPLANIQALSISHRQLGADLDSLAFRIRRLLSSRVVHA